MEQPFGARKGNTNKAPTTIQSARFLILGEQILGFVKWDADGTYSTYFPFEARKGSTKYAA